MRVCITVVVCYLMTVVRDMLGLGESVCRMVEALMILCL